MKQDLATAYRQMKSPNIKNKKESVEAIHEAKRAKKNNREQPDSHCGSFFLLAALTGATFPLLSRIQKLNSGNHNFECL